MFRTILLAVAWLTLINASLADEPVTLRVAAWNMQGNGDSNAGLLRDQLGAKNGVDLWGLSEVRKDRFDKYLEGAAHSEGTDFELIQGTTGGPKVRLAIIYDKSVLEQVGDEKELHFVTLGSHGLRAPLVARFRGKRTGQEFFFMVNHLKCCGSGVGKRRQQCKLISKWAADREIPVIMCGDLNIPFDVVTGDHDHGPSFDELTDDGPFIWLRPEYLAKTQSHDDYNTVLDYIMVANPPITNWTFEARILERDGDDPIEPGDPNDFDDDGSQTDHRPVDVMLTLNRDDIDVDVEEELASDVEQRKEVLTEDADTKTIAKRVDELEEEVAELREAIETLINVLKQSRD